jgi:hypothetical protein
VQTIVPLAQVVLPFTTAPMRVGEVWRSDIPHGRILSPDMTLRTSASVTDDVDGGWSWRNKQLSAKTISQDSVSVPEAETSGERAPSP